jgi:hypothetical protein
MRNPEGRSVGGDGRREVAMGQCGQGKGVLGLRVLHSERDCFWRGWQAGAECWELGGRRSWVDECCAGGRRSHRQRGWMPGSGRAGFLAGGVYARAGFFDAARLREQAVI